MSEDVNSFFVKQIILLDRNKQTIELNKPLSKIIVSYENKNLSLEDLRRLQKQLEKYYETIGYNFTAITIPPQNITKGTLYLEVKIPVVGKIHVKGNKYYSTDFIVSHLDQKEDSPLEYKNLLKSLLLLNNYSDLSTKLLFKKNKDGNTTDIIIKVSDNRPFHAYITFDNLGSKSTSRKRITVGTSYGNLFTDGDLINLRDTYSVDPHSTNLFSSNYTIPINTKNTKLKIGYLYTNYVATGDLKILDMKGNTKIYNLSVIQPLLKTFKRSCNLSFGYTRKISQNYILGDILSKEKINDYIITLDYQVNSLYASNSFTFKYTIGNILSDNANARANETIKFMKTNINYTRNQFLNKTNTLMFRLNTQYSPDRLSTSEMQSTGGYGSAAGFTSSKAIGDSGYIATLGWMNSRFGFQIGPFIDYSQMYANHTVKGEKGTTTLMDAGFNTNINFYKRFRLTLSAAYPIDANIDYKKEWQWYAILNIKLW